MALADYWKLKTIESIQISTADKGLSTEELSELIDTLKDNYEIKDILLKELQTVEDNQRRRSSIEEDRSM